MDKKHINNKKGTLHYIVAITLLLLYSTQVSAIGVEGSRDWWIDKYLSVSFPLERIKINSSFGKRRDPFTGKGKEHKGIDLQASYEEVMSMFDGYVKDVGHNTTSGKYIILQHGNYTVSYCHLSNIDVRQNQKVYSGDIVGVSGSTGHSTGPHLHLTCRLNNKLIDPYDLLAYVRDTKLKAIEALKGFADKVITPGEFTERYAPLAIKLQQRYGIPSSVILAQMAYESRWGNSELAQKGNNFFGIKANRDWLPQGLPYSVHDDDRKNEKFCNFSSPEESLEYYIRLLMTNRYARCWRYKSTDYHHWLLAIKASGYATRSDYAKKCESIIRQHKFHRYDILAEKQNNNNI